jgi:hypothetical protein
MVRRNFRWRCAAGRDHQHRARSRNEPKVAAARDAPPADLIWHPNQFLSTRLGLRGTFGSKGVEKIDHVLLLRRCKRLKCLCRIVALTLMQADRRRNIVGAAVVQEL